MKNNQPKLLNCIIVDFCRFVKKKIKTLKRGVFQFRKRQAANTTGYAQVRLLLACQPRMVYLLPVNGSRGSKILNWSVSLSTFSWLAIYSFIAAVFFPVVST